MDAESAFYYGLCSSRHCNICLLQDADDNGHTANMSGDGGTSAIWPVPAKKLRKCTGCFLVVYCSTKHQQVDWRMHRGLCRAVQRVLSAHRVQNLYWLTAKPTNKEEMSAAILQAKYVLRQVLDRPLKFHENELTSYAAYCNVCCKIGKLQHCKNCGGVSYCGETHRLADESAHKPNCAKLRLYYCPYKVQGVNDDWIVKWQFRKWDMQRDDLVGVFEKATGLAMPTDPTRSREAYKNFAVASDFTGITTVCYVVSYAEMRGWKEEEFVLFIVGATNERDLWFRRVHTKFFFVQYPQLTNLKLYFIGPEVADKSTQAMVDQYMFMNEVRVVEYFTFVTTFEDFVGRYKVQPSTIIAYNCGFNEFGGPDQKNPWSPAIHDILQFYKVPFAFTSYTEDEADQDFAEVMRVFKNQKEVQITYKRMFSGKPNPYRDLRPMRTWSYHNHEEFFYRNGFVQAIITFPSPNAIGASASMERLIKDVII